MSWKRLASPRIEDSLRAKLWTRSSACQPKAVETLQRLWVLKKQDLAQRRSPQATLGASSSGSSCDSRRSFSTRYSGMGYRRPQYRNLQTIMEYSQRMEVLFLRNANACAFSASLREVRCVSTALESLSQLYS